MGNSCMLFVSIHPTDLNYARLMHVHVVLMIYSAQLVKKVMSGQCLKFKKGFMIRFLKNMNKFYKQTALKWQELNLLKIKTEIFILTILIRIQTIIAKQRLEVGNLAC